VNDLTVPYLIDEPPLWKLVVDRRPVTDGADLHHLLLAVESHDGPIVTDAQGLPRFRARQRFGEVRWVAELVR
jgi:hypothetical protein